MSGFPELPAEWQLAPEYQNVELRAGDTVRFVNLETSEEFTVPVHAVIELYAPELEGLELARYVRQPKDWTPRPKPNLWPYRLKTLLSMIGFLAIPPLLMVLLLVVLFLVAAVVNSI